MKTKTLFSLILAALMQTPEVFASTGDGGHLNCPEIIDKGSDLYKDVMGGAPLEDKGYSLNGAAYTAKKERVSPRAMHRGRRDQIEQYTNDLKASEDIKWRASSPGRCEYRYFFGETEMALLLFSADKK
jgi:hypothetical protein